VCEAATIVVFLAATPIITVYYSPAGGIKGHLHFLNFFIPFVLLPDDIVTSIESVEVTTSG
jgi:hypothetical protein